MGSTSLRPRHQGIPRNALRKSELHPKIYLHYEDKYALLEEVVDEAIDAEPMLDGTTPVSMCQRAPVNEDYRLLYTDRELYPFVARRVVARGEAEGVSSIMERTGLSERDAQTLFAFTANGNLAVNQALGWRRGQEFLQAQALIRDFIAAGYEGVRHG